jgi:hypothetical protein
LEIKRDFFFQPGQALTPAKPCDVFNLMPNTQVQNVSTSCKMLVVTTGKRALTPAKPSDANILCPKAQEKNVTTSFKLLVLTSFKRALTPDKSCAASNKSQ